LPGFQGSLTGTGNDGYVALGPSAQVEEKAQELGIPALFFCPANDEKFCGFRHSYVTLDYAER
jgi:hypothetical protein